MKRNLGILVAYFLIAVSAIALHFRAFAHGDADVQKPTVAKMGEELMELDVVDFKPAYFFTRQRPPGPPLLFAYYTFTYQPTGNDPCTGKNRAIVRDCRYENTKKCESGKQVTHVVLRKRDLPRETVAAAGGGDYDATEIQPIYVPDGNGSFVFDHWNFNYRSDASTCFFLNSMSVKTYTENYSTNCTRNGIVTSIDNIHVNSGDIISN